MSASPLDFPARPPSEVEWEELLVRLEIVPRAIRLAVEDVGDSPGARAVLGRMIGTERWVGETLQAMREGRPAAANAAPPGPEGEPDARALADAFTRLRDRNFAQVQRRGLNVWEWRSEMDGGAVTAYQVMQWMARMDGETLAALRAGRGGG